MDGSAFLGEPSVGEFLLDPVGRTSSINGIQRPLKMLGNLTAWIAQQYEHERLPEGWLVSAEVVVAYSFAPVVGVPPPTVTKEVFDACQHTTDYQMTIVVAGQVVSNVTASLPASDTALSAPVDFNVGSGSAATSSPSP